MKKKHYRTIFISDIHLWNLKNQWDKLIKFLNSISFDNLIIIWDFIDYRQLKWFWKRTDKDQNTLDYINNLSNNWVKITYIQWNHDRNLKCWNKIYIENMSVIRDMYYKTLQWKTYYITHWDCMDWINKDWNSMWQLWSIVFWLLLRIEKFWNKKTLNNSYLSIAENLEDWIKKVRMPEHKIKKKIMKLTKNINCNWIIIWHFHVTRHYNLNWIDYFNTWDWLRNCSAVLEDSQWNLELVKY
jgi:UDP-2,3-diacylglucosamine pyrophosphatase LpxH